MNDNTNIARYFIDLLKKMKKDIPFDYAIVFKNFMTDENGHRIWDENDLKPGVRAKKTTILGIDDSYWKAYINASMDDTPSKRSCNFDINWNKWGSFSFEIDTEYSRNNDVLNDFLANVFLQMMNLVDHGHNIFLGSDIFIKKNTAYEHMLNIDMTSAVG